TASLFPGPLPPAAQRDPVIAVTADYADRPAHRLSLTPPVFNDARHVLFLVTGAAKAEALAAVLHGPPDPERWPAQRIQPHAGALAWYADAAAAARTPE
ncbi:MAG: 6-phosphogluconolactonase, partial [Anaerolineales bacterium]|nr:6-phosphogluconolactonase [Anaerolineales bacterium]